MNIRTCLVKEFFIDYIKSHKENIDNIPEFVIWGAGDFGGVLVKGCKEIGICPLTVMDSDSDKVGTDFFGYRVASVDEALANFPNAVVVVTMSDITAWKIKKKLAERNIKSFSFLEFFQYLASSASLLEIGPFNAPVLIGNNVKYLDVCDAPTLKQRAQVAGMLTQNVPAKIDFVMHNGNLDIVNEQFDCIFSGNLVEHQPDIIKHLQDVGHLCRGGGIYIAYIPDKRYCFDHFFPISTLEEVLAAHFEKRNNHSFLDLLRTHRHTHGNCSAHWQGDHGSQQVLTREEYDLLAKEYYAAIEQGKYVDAHAWFFVPEAFQYIIEQLQQMEFINLRLERLYPTEYLEGGFIACLRKC